MTNYVEWVCIVFACAGLLLGVVSSLAARTAHARNVQLREALDRAQLILHTEGVTSKRPEYVLMQLKADAISLINQLNAMRTFSQELLGINSNEANTARVIQRRDRFLQRRILLQTCTARIDHHLAELAPATPMLAALMHLLEAKRFDMNVIADDVQTIQDLAEATALEKSPDDVWAESLAKTKKEFALVLSARDRERAAKDRSDPGVRGASAQTAASKFRQLRSFGQRDSLG